MEITKKTSTNTLIILSFVFAWLVYTFAYIQLKANAKTALFAGYLPVISDIGLLCIAVAIAAWMYRHVTYEIKKIFCFYLLAYIFILITDIIYSIIFDVLHISNENISPILLSSYNIPFIFGLIFLFLLFTYLIPRLRIFKLNVPTPVVALIITVVFYALFEIKWEESFSLIKFYDAFSGVFELANFFMAIICVVLSRHKGLFYFSLGYIVLIATDFILASGVLAHRFIMSNSFESLWILGLLFVVYSLIIFRRDIANLVSAKNWVNEANSLNTYFSFWVFIICILTLGIFLLAILIFSPELFFVLKENLLRNFLVIFLIFIVFSVISTNFFVKVFFYPIDRITKLIDIFLRNERLPKDWSASKSPILEFQKFDEFVVRAFDTILAKIRDTKTLASRISHEIRSPLTAINISRNIAEEALADLSKATIENGDYASKYAEHIAKIGEELYIVGESIKNAALTVDLILANIKTEDINPNTFKELSMVVSVNEALRKYPFSGKSKSLVHWEAAGDFKYLGDVVLTRLVLFNLLKNALYQISIEGAGEIFIRLAQTEQSNLLIFEDTSLGVSPHILPHIFERYFSGRKGGIGLGLTFCKTVMKAYGGDIVCESEYGKFARFILRFPKRGDTCLQK